MKTTLPHIPVRVVVVLGWLIFVILMTLLPNHVHWVYDLRMLIGGTTLSDAVGHASLFGILTIGVYSVLSLRLSWRAALVLALIVGLGLATATELGQRLTPDRRTTLTDFLANWLGVFAAGTFVSLFRR